MRRDGEYSAGSLRSAAVLILVGRLLVGCGDGGEGPEQTACAMRAPDFTLPDLAQRPHRLQEYLARPVLLFFFTSWCPACRSQIPQLKEIERNSDSLGMRLVAIGAGLADTSENIRAYAVQHRLPYIVLYDDGSAVSERLGVETVPAAFLIRTDRCMIPIGSRVSVADIRALLEQSTRSTAWR